MEMVKGLCCKHLPDIIIAARCQLDVLAIPGLFFLESFLQKKLNRTTEVLLQQAILLGGYHCCIDWLRKVVVHHLLLGHFVLAGVGRHEHLPIMQDVLQRFVIKRI